MCEMELKILFVYFPQHLVLRMVYGCVIWLYAFIRFVFFFFSKMCYKKQQQPATECEKRNRMYKIVTVMLLILVFESKKKTFIRCVVHVCVNFDSFSRFSSLVPVRIVLCMFYNFQFAFVSKMILFVLNFISSFCSRKRMTWYTNGVNCSINGIIKMATIVSMFVIFEWRNRISNDWILYNHWKKNTMRYYESNDGQAMVCILFICSFNFQLIYIENKKNTTKRSDSLTNTRTYRFMVLLDYYIYHKDIQPAGS